MPANPEVQSLLDFINALDAPPLAEQTLEEVRSAYGHLAVEEGEDVASVTDHVVTDGVHGDFGIRLYRPAGSNSGEDLPLLIWYHGGGFAIGGLDTADATVRALANAARIVVASVDYHLAPEHPYPAAVDDAVIALDWSIAHASTLGIDPERIAVGGDSAGGNLAAVVCQLARAAGRPSIALQLLVYPVTDLVGEYPSMAENGTGKRCGSLAVPMTAPSAMATNVIPPSPCPSAVFRPIRCRVVAPAGVGTTSSVRYSLTNETAKRR